MTVFVQLYPNILKEPLKCATAVHINKTLIQSKNCCPLNTAKCTVMNHGTRLSDLINVDL